MRLISTVEVSGGTVVVRELTVGQIRQLISDFSEGGEFQGHSLLQPANQDLERVLNKFDILQLPNEQRLDDLSLSEVMDVVEAFRKLHKDFLDLINQGAQKVMSQMKNNGNLKGTA
ncbi:MAG: hypothetical protein BWK78_00430 [Thiotrichaceae bacterium IS1]|nr:MAG: hypothetical protein BWK78_00430 [Thiotrichaceae bacterium IS1]